METDFAAVVYNVPMSNDLRDVLVVAISSRALFDLDEENRIFEQQGLEVYRRYQVENESTPMAPGTAFALVQALLAINQLGKGHLVEVVLVSRNDADTGLRVMNSLEHYGLPISRAGFTDGQAPYEYLAPFSCDLFLSAHEEDVRSALRSGFAAALVYRPPSVSSSDPFPVRIAFDGDAVLFSGESEQVVRNFGLAEFHRREKESAELPLGDGPFKGFLMALHAIQCRFGESDCPIRTALVTARGVPAHKRAINTLRAWNIRVDEAFFLGGMSKSGVLNVFAPHIFFDDQAGNCDSAAAKTPTARVPAD